MVEFSPRADRSIACPGAGCNQETQFRKLAIQWNIRGLRGALPDLQIMLNEGKNHPLSLALQETFMGNDADNITLNKKYHFHHLIGSTTHKGGVCLAVLRNIPQTRINITTEIQICAVRIEGPQTMTLASIYIPPSYQNNNLKNELNDIIKQLPLPLVLMGDFNANHTIWGSKDNNTRGKIILEFAESHNLIILNDNQQTRIDPRNGATSAIDLTIVSWELVSKIRMEVDTDSRGSDHFPIHLHLSNKPPDISTRRRWKYELADWTSYEISSKKSYLQTHPTHSKK